jgi:hypothetical protein
MLEVPLHLASHQQAARPTPPGSTTVHLLPAVPIPAGLTGVVRGATAALSPKRPGRHPRLGTLASRSPWVGVASAAWLAARRWPQGADLLIPGHPVLAAVTCACRCPRSASSTPTDPTGGRHVDVPQPEAPTSNPKPATAPRDARTAVRPPTGPGLRRQVCADQGQGPCDRPAGSIFVATPTFIRIA